MEDLHVLRHKITHPVNTFDVFPRPGTISTIELICDEVTSVCPVTGQPDFAVVRIKYVPNEFCIESKSLKLYLWQFRESGIFCEALADKICSDIFEQCKPFSCEVEVQQKSRGGIAIYSRAVR